MHINYKCHTHRWVFWLSFGSLPYRTEHPKLRYCHAVGAVPYGPTTDHSKDTDQPLIRIGWTAVDNAGGLHRGYTVTAIFAANNTLVWDDPLFISKTYVSWTFTSHGGGGTFALQRNVVYDFAIRAVYGDSNITSLPASCGVELGLPCAPLHNVSQTCGCPNNAVHSCGRPGASQPTWQCERCPRGTNCSGGTYLGLKTLPGWYVK